MSVLLGSQDNGLTSTVTNVYIFKAHQQRFTLRYFGLFVSLVLGEKYLGQEKQPHILLFLSSHLTVLLRLNLLGLCHLGSC